MYNNLVDHAIRNVWCTPDQDSQAIIKLSKITGVGGVWNTVNVFWRSINLPEPAVRFHVYQIGQLYPALLCLADSDSIWTNLASACNKNSVVIDIYSDNGLQLPRTETWYMVTADRNIIVAVKEQPNINIDLDLNPVYIRVYNNAYFASSRSDPLNDYIEVNGGHMINTSDILALQAKFNNASALPGATYAFINGFKVSTINLLTVKPGDVAEYVYDSSIRSIVDLPISSLQTFTSTLDSNIKYLLSYDGVGDSSIDFQDDIDFFIVGPDINSGHRGVYYHKNRSDAVRMVTYKDYSLVVSYVAGYAHVSPDWVNADNLTIRMHIRKSGYKRGLTFENNRTEELFKLPFAKRLDALVGLNSTVNVWKAAVLEESAYVVLMGSKFKDINITLVQNAYGYNAITKLLADTPVDAVLFSNVKTADVPYGLMTNSVAYEYDSNGLLLGWYQHSNSTKYNAVSQLMSQVEMLAGISSLALDEVYGSGAILDPTLEYRFYKCQIVNGAPDNIWIDITGTNEYMIINNSLVWNIDPTLNYTLVRSNKNILTYSLNLMENNGLLNFSLEHMQTHAGIAQMHLMQIPMGELDIFMNGYSLIEGIDYVVNFPDIIITNKSYLNLVATAPQAISVRFTGFCNSDFSRNTISDGGFIKHGLLSNNNRFDIRDDKVLRIIVGGKLYNRKSLKFSETDSGVTVPNALNGLPYLIRDIVVPLRGITTVETYANRAASVAIDTSISDYMTRQLPEPVITAPNVITMLHATYSPFCSKIISDVRNNVINDPRLKTQYNDSVVFEICKPYEYLLKFDLTQPSLKKDPNYVVVHPHYFDNVVNVNIYQYKFIDRMVRLYLNGMVDISNFISII